MQPLDISHIKAEVIQWQASQSPDGPVATITVTGAVPTRRVVLTGALPPPDDVEMTDLSAKVDKLDDRLRLVEVAVGKIETQLSHVATKTWIMGGVILVLVSMLGGGWWIVQQYLIPILQRTGP